MDNEAQVQAARVALGTALAHTFEVQSAIFEDMKGPITVSLPDARGVMQMGIASAKHRTDPVTGRVTLSSELDGQSKTMEVILATLTVVVTKAPHWWYREDGAGAAKRLIPAPELLQDTDLLYEIFGRYADWRESFRSARLPSHQDSR